MFVTMRCFGEDTPCRGNGELKNETIGTLTAKGWSETGPRHHNEVASVWNTSCGRIVVISEN
jgi:hypothetical protein